MALVGASEAARIIGRDRSIIYRAMNKGQLSAQKNALGATVIDAAELLRVFPPESNKSGSKTPDDTPADDDIVRQARDIRAKSKLETEKFKEDLATWISQRGYAKTSFGSLAVMRGILEVGIERMIAVEGEKDALEIVQAAFRYIVGKNAPMLQ